VFRSSHRCKPPSPAGLNKAAVKSALAAGRGPGSQRATSPSAENAFSTLDKYGIDLTAQAAKLDPVIGREDEIRRLTQVLCRRTKNNPVLIGEPGVGKTALVEGLAQRIAHGDVPSSLRDCKIVALDSACLDVHRFASTLTFSLRSGIAAGGRQVPRRL